MPDFASTCDNSAKCLCYALVAETDAEDRDFSCEMLYHVDRNSRLHAHIAARQAGRQRSCCLQRVQRGIDMGREGGVKRGEIRPDYEFRQSGRSSFYLTGHAVWQRRIVEYRVRTLIGFY